MEKAGLRSSNVRPHFCLRRVILDCPPHPSPRFLGSDFAPTLRLGSTSFASDASLPVRLTCDGANLSPDIKLSPMPPLTKSWAIVMDDPTAPLGFILWIIYNLPTSTTDLSEGASNRSALPAEASEGLNDFGEVRYRGPCPPSGQHRYRLRAYALDLSPTLPGGETIEALSRVASRHIRAFGQLEGFLPPLIAGPSLTACVHELKVSGA